MSSIANCVIPSGLANGLQSAALTFFGGEVFPDLLFNMRGDCKGSTPTGEAAESEGEQKDSANDGPSIGTANIAAFVVVQLPVEVAPVQATPIVPELGQDSIATDGNASQVRSVPSNSGSEKHEQVKAGGSMESFLQGIAGNCVPVAEVPTTKSQASGQQRTPDNETQKASAETARIFPGNVQETLLDRAKVERPPTVTHAPPSAKLDGGLPLENPETKVNVQKKADIASKPQVTIGDKVGPSSPVTQVTKTRQAGEIIEARARNQNPHLDPDAKPRPQIGSVFPLTGSQSEPVEVVRAIDSPSRSAEVSAIPPIRAAIHLERLTERLAGSEFHFGFASSDAGTMRVTAAIRNGTVDLGVSADRVETARALKAEVPVLEANLRERSLHLGEINIASGSSRNASMYSDGQRRGRPEYLPRQIVSSPAPEPNSSVVEETASWIRDERSSVSLLA